MAGFVTGVHLQPSNLSALSSGFPHPEESHTTFWGGEGIFFSLPTPAALSEPAFLLLLLLFHALFSVH